MVSTIVQELTESFCRRPVQCRGTASNRTEGQASLTWQLMWVRRRYHDNQALSKSVAFCGILWHLRSLLSSSTCMGLKIVSWGQDETDLPQREAQHPVPGTKNPVPYRFGMLRLGVGLASGEPAIMLSRSSTTPSTVFSLS